MASPSPSIASTKSSSLRNPRRKRHGSEEGASLRQQPQRKKSRLNSDVSALQATSLANGHAGGNLRKTGRSALERRGSATPSQTRTIPFRAVASEAPQSKLPDDAITLTWNEKYTVKQLLNFPSAISQTRQADFRGIQTTRSGHALAITRSQAFVWQYTSSASGQAIRVFNLAYPAKAHDVLPFGALVPSGSASSYGLVVVNATSGKISFWEDVDHADALNLFERRRNGAEGSCGSLLSGETVTNVEAVGAGGFVLSFSSGRTAQLMVRDAQSRPAIQVNFLRGRPANTGFFGGLNSVFGGAGFLKSIAATRYRPLDLRDRAETIIGNEDAVFQFWQMNWAGQPTLSREVDAQAILNAAVFPVSAPESRVQNATLIDFAIATDNADGTDLLLLVNFTTSWGSTYALVEVDIDAAGASARRTIVLNSYAQSTTVTAKWKPRLILPSPGHTAFAIFEDAITLVTLSTLDLSPDAQFLMDVGQLPEPFQDTIQFRPEKGYVSCGVSVEASDRIQAAASAVVFVENFGLLRIAAEEPGGTLPSGKRRTLSVKSMIEQAVFFGSMESNPLNLTRSKGQPVDREEVEDAAVRISYEILSSESPFVVPVAASMAEHLEKRAANLDMLAKYVLNLSNDISRSTRWRLRHDAEKLAACRTVWGLYDGLMHARWKEMRVLSETLVIMGPDEKTTMERDHGENDRVRLWCTKDVWRMEKLFQWVIKSIDILQESDMIRDSEKYMDLVNETNSIVIEGLAAAYEFRVEHSVVYGLETETYKHGVLYGDYTDLFESWTSDPYLLVQLQSQIERVRKTVLTATEAVKEAAQLVPAVKTMILNSASLVNAYCRGFEERTQWQWSQKGNGAQQEAEDLQSSYSRSRTSLVVGLLELGGLYEEAAEIAERYEDLDALVQIINVRKELMADRGEKLSADSIRTSRAFTNGIQEQVSRYHKRFGDRWLEAILSTWTPAEVLNYASRFNAEASNFIEADPLRARYGWINDIIYHKDHAAASRALNSVAEDQESVLWSKKVELSLAKLALNASGESKLDKSATRDDTRLVEIQEQLFEHIQPSLYGALDDAAKTDLAIETFGETAASETPALAHLLRNGFQDLISHTIMTPDQLIDVLTLMDEFADFEKGSDITGQTTYLALKVLDNGGFTADRQKFNLTLRLIWQRCFNRDDWAFVNNTGRKVDSDAIADLEATSLFSTIYECLSNGLFESTSGVSMLGAAQCVNAGTTADDFKDRFTDAEIRRRMALDVAHHSKTLESLMESAKLEHWIKVARDVAERKLKEEVTSKEENDGKLRELVEAIHNEEPHLNATNQTDGASVSWLQAVRRVIEAK